MFLPQSLLISLLFPVIYALECPQNYTDGGDGSCYYWNPNYLPTQARNWLYDDCSRQGGYLLDVANAFQNSGIQNKASAQRYAFKNIMLGLTCLGGSCQWDSGLQSSYSNFATGLDTSIGICVMMEISTGLWYSADCSATPAQYACKWTPEIQIPVCKDEPQLYSTVLRNSCYFAPHGSNNASSCLPGTPTSIHSDEENSFILKFANANYLQGPMLIGLGINGSQMAWVDGTPVDYYNFWTNNPGFGDCVAMALGNELNGVRIPAGTWITVGCGRGPSSYSSVFCKADAVTSQLIK